MGELRQPTYINYNNSSSSFEYSVFILWVLFADTMPVETRIRELHGGWIDWILHGHLK